MADISLTDTKDTEPGGQSRGRRETARLIADTTLRLRAAGCVFAEDEARLLVAEGGTRRVLERMTRQRENGQPLEHVVGWARFCGLRVGVAPGVFVPRARTELMARRAVVLARRAPSPPVLVDLCCGSGAVALAVLDRVDTAVAFAVDLDQQAVAVARRNLHGRARVFQGDLYRPLPPTLRGRVHVITANVPYVPTAAIAYLPGEARLHEPTLSLDGGADGLDVLRRVAVEAPEWLARGGHVLVETSEAQASVAVETFAGCGLSPRVSRSAPLEATVVVGTLRT